MSHDNWRELAERVTKEQDHEKLMALVKELTGVLSQRKRLPSNAEKPD